MTFWVLFQNNAGYGSVANRNYLFQLFILHLITKYFNFGYNK